MTDPDLWWCPRCQTSNSVGALRCVVCDDARPATAAAPAPSPAATAPTESAVLFTSPDAPPPRSSTATAAACAACGAALRPGHPFCANCGTAVTAGVAGPGGATAPVPTPVGTTAAPSNRTWLWAVSTLVIVVAVAIGVFVLTRPKPNDGAQPVRTKDDGSTQDAQTPGANVSTDGSARTTLTAPTTTPATVGSTVVVTAPTTTPAAALPSSLPASDRAPAGTPTPVLDALDVAQDLATGLAHDDWNLVRQLEPGKSNLSDAKFYAQYNDLDESTAILVSSSQQGSSYSLRLGLVAHQNGSQTSIYCVTWVVNASSRTVIESTSGTKIVLDHASGTLDPLQQVDTIRSRC